MEKAHYINVLLVPFFLILTCVPGALIILRELSTPEDFQCWVT